MLIFRYGQSTHTQTDRNIIYISRFIVYILMSTYTIIDLQLEYRHARTILNMFRKTLTHTVLCGLMYRHLSSLVNFVVCLESNALFKKKL